MNQVLSQFQETKSEAMKALHMVMLPIVRIFMRFGLTHADIHEVTKTACVQAAAEDGAIDGRPPTRSRIALLTGLSRGEVANRLRRGREMAMSTPAAHEVLKIWNSDPRWQDAEGRPLELPLDGIRSFNELCRQCTTSYSPQTVVDQLLHSGSIELTDRATVRFTNAGFVPVDVARRLQAGLHSVKRLLETVHHNVAGLFPDRTEPPRYQQIYWSNYVPREAVGPLREKLQSLLRDMRAAGAAEIDQVEDPPSPVERDTAGIGLFYFEDPQETKSL